MRGGLLVLAAIPLLAGSALAAFSPLSPAVWIPPADILGKDACLRAPTLAARPLADGLPGSVDGLSFGKDGKLRAAVSSGQIVAVDPANGQWRVIARGGSFLTGLATTADYGIAVVDEKAGALLTGAPGGPLRTLLRRVDGQPLTWANDVTALSDRTLVLTTTATGRSLDAYFPEVLEHRGTGRLIAYDTVTHEARLLRGDLQMTNGIAATEDGQRLLVAQSALYGFDIMTPRGETVKRIAGLPGVTGNIRRSDRPGRFWVTLLSPRSSLIDGTADKPLLRRLLGWLPAAVRPRPTPLPCLIEVDVAQPEPRLKAWRLGGAADGVSISTAIERGGMLYLSPASIVKGASGRVLTARLRQH